MKANIVQITGNDTVGPFKLDGLIPGSPWSIAVSGTFDGGTVTLQMCGTSDGTFFDMEDGVFTANDVKVSDLPIDNYFQVVGSGTGASTDVLVVFRGTPRK